MSAALAANCAPGAVVFLTLPNEIHPHRLAPVGGSVAANGAMARRFSPPLGFGTSGMVARLASD